MCASRERFTRSKKKERKKERSQTDHTRERERQRMNNKERIVARDGRRIRRIALKKKGIRSSFFDGPIQNVNKKKRERKRCRDIKLPSLSKSAPA